MITKLEELIELAKGKEKKTIAVAAAQDKPVLEAVSDAVKLGIVNAILVGDKVAIEKIAKENNINIDSMEIIHEEDLVKSAAKAVECVVLGKAQYLMKGLLGTSVLLKAVLNKEVGLRGQGLLSHVMVYDLPTYHKLIYLTDGGMVMYPQLKEKVGIIENAVKVAYSLGNNEPKVAALCAVEVVNPSMQATVDAASLAQMNKSGEIKGCMVEGPLALDNAISKEAAEHKGIKSEIAGDVDILLVHSIETGNALGKSMTYFANGKSAGVIMGAKCPIVLVSRADSAESKLYSIALGALIDA